MRRLQLHLSGEILRPTAAALLLLLQLLFAVQLLRAGDVIFGSGASVRELARMALDLAPHFLVLTMPIALLVGTLVGLGRLAEDRELLATSAAGIDPLWALPVPLLTAAALAGLALFLGRNIEPLGLASVRASIEQVLRTHVRAQVKPGIFFEGLTGLTLYAEQVDEKAQLWSHVMVSDQRDPNAPVLILAAHGQLDDGSGSSLVLHLSDGHLHRAVASGTDYALAAFARGRMQVGLQDGRFRRFALRSASDALPVSDLRAAARSAPTPARARELWTDLARRSALPLAPLALVLVAVPLAFRIRGARALGFALASGAYALYYVAARAGQQWGNAGALNPNLAAQLPNLLFAAAGLALLVSARRRA